MGVAVSFIFVGIFLLFKESIAGAFLKDEAPRTIAVGLLGVAAVMQMADHSQILSSGVLRGIDDVKRPALIMFLSHWVVGVPLGLTLGFATSLGASGIWWGLSTGLMLTAVLLGKRAWKMTGTSNP